MSLYILDTDTLRLFRNGHPRVLQRVQSVSPADLAITIISVEEQLTGADDIARAYERFTDAMRFLTGRQVQFLSFSILAVHRFNTLVSLKLNVGKMDLRIAAIAPEHGAIVVTRNTRAFTRVPNLTIEDWSV